MAKILVLTIICVVYAILNTNFVNGEIEKQQQGRGEILHFVVSAWNLPGKDTNKKLDPFVKVYLAVVNNGMGTPQPPPDSRSDTNNETEIISGGRVPIELKPLDVSEYLTDDLNPQWNRVFQVQWYPETSQKLFLEIRDHDPFAPDDSVGDATIDLDDYVRRGQDLTTNLHMADSEPGSLGESRVTLKKTEPFSFALAARNLPNKDEFNSKSDPYVECYFRRGKDGEDIKFFTTTVINNEENPSWDTPIVFPNYQKSTNQYLHFKVKDHDAITSDDSLGEALLSVDPFVAHPIAKNLALGENGNDGNSVLIISALKRK